MSLVVDWCDVADARLACKRWHYSGSIAVGRIACLGVWEHERFVGAVVFARGAAPRLGDQFGLIAGEYAELVRVALRGHEAPVSAIVTRAVALLRSHAPNLRLLVSFADPRVGHHGGIYQAMNWLYLGPTPKMVAYVCPDGSIVHWRAAHGRQFHTKAPTHKPPPGAVVQRLPGKHKYVLPLDRAMRRKLAPLALPYPRGRSVTGDTAGVLPAEAGSIPAGRSTTSS